MSVGRVVGGRYRLVEGLASGGFGRVWAAYDETLSVEVAVKEVWLPPAGSDEVHRERVARATREARNAAKLRDHPHVVAVHDVVVEDGVPWTVMRLVDGCSLEEHLRTQGPLPVPRVAEVAAALLKALGAAHALGIVHRDVKPANVMLTRDGHVLLTDFGISVHHADTALTVTGGIIGSVEYMAPERLNGVDEAAGDLFSLGVTLYQAVEGVSPFRRETPAATLAAIALTQAPPPGRAGALAPLIARLLAKEPRDRPTPEAALGILGGGTTMPTPESEPPPSHSGPPAASTAVVRVTNRTGAQVRVVLDSADVGTVESDESGTFEGRPGAHNVQVAAGQHGSEARTFRARRNSARHFVAAVRRRDGRVDLRPAPAMSRAKGLVVGLIGLALNLVAVAAAIVVSGDTLFATDVWALVIESAVVYTVGGYMLQIGFRAVRNRPISFRAAVLGSLAVAVVCALVLLGILMPKAHPN